MHDMKMRELKVGDRVLVPCRIKEIHATEDYCNIMLESAAGRRPDGKKETISAINSAVTLKYNAEDAGKDGEQWRTLMMIDIADAFVLR